MKGTSPIVRGMTVLIATVTATCVGQLRQISAADRVDSSLPERVEFNRDIRPILSDKCFACHGPDENQREADLRLDRESDAHADRGGYAAIQPGNAKESELYRRVSSTDADERMPPESFGKDLSPREVALLRHWIKQGGKWQKHWSFIAPTRPSLPNNAGNPWPRVAIDDFILERLTREGLFPSPEADPRTLIRRVYFDLIGLPPSPDVVDRFMERANDPAAYEETVDGLLDSKHFGERMATYWLDLVRFADTNGIHGDNHREVALFRDYIIHAFNENIPFDQFTIEQIAGDLIEQPTRMQTIASGYNRLLMTTREGGAQPKEYQAKYDADRVRNVSSVWLGATLGCAECHDHKFDPYTTKDFYSFAAFFADIKERAVGTQKPIRLPTDGQQAQLTRLQEQVRLVQAILDTPTPELAEAEAAWEKVISNRSIDWQVLRPEKAVSTNGTTLTVGDDGIVSASGQSPDKDVYALHFTTMLRDVTALRLQVLASPDRPESGLGRSDSGDFVLTEFKVSADGQPVDWSGAVASGETIEAAIDGKNDSGWRVARQPGETIKAVFQVKPDVVDDNGVKLSVRLEQNRGGRRTLRRFRIEATNAVRPVGVPLTRELQDILSIDNDDRTNEQQATLTSYHRSITPLLAEKRQHVRELNRQIKAVLDSAPQMLVSVSTDPRVMRVLPRGNWLDDSGPVVTPNVPASLPPLEITGQRANRMDLARWLVTAENPMVARVFVNRLWKIVFGHGLVRSLDDFGSQGTWPTHLSLLDWLAVEFVESGWDVKYLVKLMVMSGTYRQSSLVPEDLQDRDPFNELLARQGRFRLDAEMIRDNALAIAGTLELRVGGKSVKPYQPAGYWAHLNFPKRAYQNDHGEDLYRRGVYTYWARTFLHPSLLAFDAPSREECSVERPRSNTPQQALVLLNDPTYVEAARVFGERIVDGVTAGGEEAADLVERRIRFAYRETLSREPSPEELTILRGIHDAHLGQYRTDGEAASALINVGERSPKKGLDPAEVATWTSLSRVLLNLHETITRS